MGQVAPCKQDEAFASEGQGGPSLGAHGGIAYNDPREPAVSYK
jgi:hypothetical protein